MKLGLSYGHPEPRQLSTRLKLYLAIGSSLRVVLGFRVEPFLCEHHIVDQWNLLLYGKSRREREPTADHNE